MADDEFPIARAIAERSEKILPEGSVPLVGVYLVTFLDADGDENRSWYLEGAPNLDTVFGIFEMAKFRMVADVYEDDD